MAPVEELERCRSLAARLLTLALALAFPAVASAGSEVSAPLWKVPLDGKLKTFKVTMLGDLAVGTETGLVYLDGSTGATKWRRPSIQSYWDGIDRSKGGLYGWTASEDSVHVVDAPGGEIRWNLWGRLPGKPRGFTISSRLGLVVACVKNQGLVSLVALDLKTGDQRWRQDSLFVSWPEPEKDDDNRIGISNALHGPTYNPDSTVVVWPRRGGPIRIDLRTGALVWRSAEAERAFAKQPGWSDPEWDRDGGTIAVASKRQVIAIRDQDGTVAWKKSADYPADINMVAARGNRVVVAGFKKPFYDLLDLDTGASVLQEPRKLKGLTSINVGDSTLLFVADGRLHTVGLGTGDDREVAKIDLKHDDQVEGIRVRRSGYILQSRQNLVALGTDGTVRYQRDYEAPGAGFFSELAISMGYSAPTSPRTDPELEAARSRGDLELLPDLKARIEAVLAARDWAYFYTGQPDSKGHTGFSLVRVDRETGDEVGRIWLDQRDPVYRIDDPTGTVFVKADREIRAYRF